MTATTPRAVGIVRVSQEGNRGDSLESPADQVREMEGFCADRRWQLTVLEHEIDVSGDAPLEDRPSLSRAVLMVQTGAADVILAGDGSRLWWNQEVRAQVLRLVEQHGGEVWTVANGCLTNPTAAQDFSDTVITGANRMTRIENGDKSRRVVVKKISEGVVPFGQVSPPFRLTDDNHAEVVPEQLPVVTEALRMRGEDRAPINDIRAYLREHGIERSYNGVMTMLANPMLVGELHFGKTDRTKGGRPGRLRQKLFDPVVDRDLWRRAQSAKALPGRRAKSERLLARLGVLRCATCDARMVVGSAHHAQYPLYKCPPNNDCARHVTVSATLVEDIVVAEVRRLLADVEGTASALTEVQEADADLKQKQAELDALIELLDPLEPAARKRLATATDLRDGAQKRVDELSGSRTALTVTVEDWDRLTLAERRGLIKATIARAVVAPGRGASRVTVEAFGQ